MKVGYWGALFAIGLGFGLGLGWLMNPHLMEAKKGETERVGDERLRGASSRSESSGRGSQVRSRFIPAELRELTQKAGYFGYDEGEREKLIEVLTAWYLESPEETLAWVKGASPYPVLVRQLEGELIVGVATVDFDQGMELANSVGEILVEHVTELFKLSTSHGANAVVQVAEFGIGDSGRPIFPYCDFPESFDFETTLNELADLGARLEKGKGFQVLPGNILGEWAKVDPNAAWRWLEEGRELKGNDSKLDYFKGYRHLVEDYELGETVSEHLGFDEDGAKGFMHLFLWGSDEQEMSGDLLKGYFSGAEPDQRVEVLADLIGRSAEVATEWGDRIRTALLVEMGPATRLSAVAEAWEDLDQLEKKTIGPILREMGHDQDELDQFYKNLAK